jgi:hypothetical protein
MLFNIRAPRLSHRNGPGPLTRITCKSMQKGDRFIFRPFLARCSQPIRPEGGTSPRLRPTIASEHCSSRQGSRSVPFSFKALLPALAGPGLVLALTVRHRAPVHQKDKSAPYRSNCLSVSCAVRSAAARQRASSTEGSALISASFTESAGPPRGSTLSPPCQRMVSFSSVIRA